MNVMLYAIVVFSALGGLLFGYDTGVISGALLFMKDEFNLSVVWQQVIVSITLVGAMCGAMVGGSLADYAGRRRAQLCASFLFVGGSLVITFAHHVAVLVVGRLVVGVAIGIASLTVPLYIAEVAPTNLRGSLVSYNQLFITIGILGAYIVGYLLAPSKSWRWMFGLSVFPAVIQGIGTFIIPESPRWFMKRQQEDQAMSSLWRLRGKNHIDTPEESLKAEIEQIKATLEGTMEEGNAKQWRSLFEREARAPIIVGTVLAIIQQITGINTVIYYSPTIINESEKTAILASIAVGAVMVVATWIAVLIMDKFGRRKLLMVGIFGMSVSLLVLSIGFFVFGDDTSTIAWLAVASLMALGPILWLIISEIYPLRVRGKAMSLATCVEWGANFVVSMSFLSLVEVLQSSGAFLLYAVIGFLSLFFVYFRVPETKDKSLEEIELELSRGPKLPTLSHRAYTKL